MFARVKLEDSLTRHRRVGILPQRRQCISLPRSATAYLTERVDVSSGERHDARAWETLHHSRRHDRIHRPCRSRILCCAKFEADEVNDIGGFRKLGFLL